MMKRLFLTFVLSLAPIASYADIKVFACEPEWAELAIEIGQQHVDAYSATTAYQDPHYVQARPSLIAKVRRADLVICSGAELEIGWLPVLLQKANNRKVMPGSSGYIEASALVERFDATANVDRSQGDIHPLGNPYVQANPHNISVIATAVADRYGKDRTFSVPILMMCALGGRLGGQHDGWKRVLPLPFELAAFPRRWFAALRLPSSKVMAYTYLTPSWVILWTLAMGQAAPPALILVGVGMTVIALLLLLRDDSVKAAVV